MSVSQRIKTKRVVIIGGGFAGRRAERLLMADFEVTVVDAKGFWEYTPAALRCLVEPEHASKTVLNNPVSSVTATVTDILPNGDSNTATSSDAPVPSQLMLDDGRTLEFDYCLLAAGSQYADPIKPQPMQKSSAAARIEHYKKAHEELDRAAHVLIIGGGITGVELAAEILGKYKNRKAVTLVNSTDQLLPRMPASAGSYAMRWLETRGCKVMLNQRVTVQENASATSSYTAVTLSGQMIDADIVYQCGGMRQVAAPLTEHFRSFVSEGGGVAVNEHLQVGTLSNVFAAGDCTSTEEEKNALAADLAAELAATNIQRAAAGQPLLVFPRDVCHGLPRVPSITCVSLYKWQGILQFNNLVLTGRIPTLVKLLVEKLQIGLAAGNTAHTNLWTFIEKANIFAGRYLFHFSSPVSLDLI